jgi:hypothetical protein
MKQVTVERRGIESYRRVIGDATIDHLLELAGPPRGKRVVHVNATPAGPAWPRS